MLQHQLVQSPARLGLTNPTSPSLQNPTPQALTTPVSSTLLSLLPPLPRAQSLLHQLASLSSKLFDLSPNRALWLSSFRGQLPVFLSSQTSPLPDISSLKDALSLFSSLHSQLFEAVSQLQEILDLQDHHQRISREVHALDSNLLSFANKLKESERVLDILVDDYSDYRKPKRSKLTGDDVDGDVTETTIASKVKLSDILSYAHKISYTTFAPPEFGAGTAPLRGAMPPAPQDEQMRASQLYNFANLDVGLPKLDETKERTIEAIIEAPTPQNVEGNVLGSLANMLPPNITVPSGWKPGMPVVLPKDLPVPPPGWKPGDPLPPLESLPAPRIVEPPQNVGVAKQPEAIQVRHVQIDILDQDDDSSDYSSDEGSSDDED